jgi:ABC-2 type transport system permease protein
MAMVEGYKILAILAALMAAQTVVRHTRREEETGRAELVGSAVVGRHAQLAAAMLVALGAGLVLGAGVALGIGVHGLGWAGAWAEGLAVAGTCWVFAGIAAVAAQVLSTARAANAVAAGALGVAFVLRATGDLSGRLDATGIRVVSAWPSWLSPLGWGQQVRPYDEDNWPVAALFAALTGALVVVAAVLVAHRDAGAGMVPARRGPARAPVSLLSVTGLTWRIQRGVLTSWAVGLAVAGAVFGSVGDEFVEYVAENETIGSMLAQIAVGAEPLELYQAFLMALLGVTAAGYTVQALLRMRAEEVSGRLEPVLATATGRSRWLASHVVVVGLGTALVLTGSGVAGGLAYGLVTRRWDDAFGGLTAAALVQVPAALALGAFVVAVFGLLPRWSAPVTWFALAAALVMGQLGALLELPQWLLNVSPFTHVPAVPAETVVATPLLWLVVAALALTVAGFATFRRRDLAIGA